jgi:hypothetical protein
MGLSFRATLLPLRSFPKECCSQILSGSLPRSRCEPSNMLAQHLSQRVKFRGADSVSQPSHPHRFQGSRQDTYYPHRRRTHSPVSGNNPALPVGFGVDGDDAMKRLRSIRLDRSRCRLLPKGSHILSKVNSSIVTSSGLSNPRRTLSRCSG